MFRVMSASTREYCVMTSKSCAVFLGQSSFATRRYCGQEAFVTTDYEVAPKCGESRFGRNTEVRIQTEHGNTDMGDLVARAAIRAVVLFKCGGQRGFHQRQSTRATIPSHVPWSQHGKLRQEPERLASSVP